MEIESKSKAHIIKNSEIELHDRLEKLKTNFNLLVNQKVSLFFFFFFKNRLKIIKNFILKNVVFCGLLCDFLSQKTIFFLDIFLQFFFQKIVVFRSILLRPSPPPPTASFFAVPFQKRRFRGL